MAKHVLSEGPRSLLFGSGPTTFSFNWAKYRDPLINQTQFWNVAFTQGFSWFSTLISSVGILGAASFFVFLILSIILFLRHLLKFPHENHTSLGMSMFIGLVAMILICFLYPSSLTFVITLFLLIGLLSSVLAHPEPIRFESQEASSFEQQEGIIMHDGNDAVPQSTRPLGWWDITSLTMRFENSWLLFASSLFAIFFLSLGVAAMYLQIQRLRAALTQQYAVALFSKGDVDGAVIQLEKAASFEDKNYINYIPLVQARMEKIRGLVQRAADGTNVQQQFQGEVSVAIQNSQTAIQLNPANPMLWRLQGSLYELLIPFIPGSENFAFSSYRKAIELDPLNPSLDIDLARAGLTAVDRLALTIQQSPANNREQLTQVRTNALNEIMQVLNKAIEIKPDLADSHFLATQTSLRLGNTQAAIESAEKAKIAAPFDTGAAFQLGLLYYQMNETDKAQVEFERAVALNNNYSNARYFLGLIYSRKGDTEKALQQFQQIEALNPDNQEVKRIIANLQSGKSALESIVPPAQPPEKRTETPVKEGRTKAAR